MMEPLVSKAGDLFSVTPMYFDWHEDPMTQTTAILYMGNRTNKNPKTHTASHILHNPQQVSQHQPSQKTKANTQQQKTKTQIMKYTALFAASTAAVASAQSDGQRNLATLAAKWNVTDPEFLFDSNTFSLSFPVTDYINAGMAAYSLWTAPDCLDGGVDISDRGIWANHELVENDALLDAAAYDSTTMLDSGEFSGRGVNITMEFNPQTISADNGDTGVYSESTIDNQLTAQVRFCVRFGLWTTPLDVTTPVEVNFIETLITLVVDLTDGFEIGAIDVEAKDRLIRTANQAYEVRGYECSAASELPLSAIDQTRARNQGEIIHVCVTPEDEATQDGIFMRSIDDFAFTRVDGTRQVAIQDGAEAGNLLTSYNDATCIGATVCRFSTILFAQFYATPGAVGGEGVASMQFGGAGGTSGRRALRAGAEDARDLQVDTAGAAEFELTFEVNQQMARVRASGAGSSSVRAAMSLGGIAAIAAML